MNTLNTLKGNKAEAPLSLVLSAQDLVMETWAQAREEIDALKNALKDAHQTIETLTTKIYESSIRLNAAHARLESTQEALDVSQRLLKTEKDHKNTAKQKINTLETGVSAARSKIAELEKTLKLDRVEHLKKMAACNDAKIRAQKALNQMELRIETLIKEAPKKTKA